LPSRKRASSFWGIFRVVVANVFFSLFFQAPCGVRPRALRSRMAPTLLTRTPPSPPIVLVQACSFPSESALCALLLEWTFNACVPFLVKIFPDLVGLLLMLSACSCTARCLSEVCGHFCPCYCFGNGRSAAGGEEFRDPSPSFSSSFASRELISPDPSF